MTEIASLLVNLLEEEWQESRPDRDEDVPQPEITRDKKTVTERLSTTDVIRVASGGEPTAEMASFGGKHENAEVLGVLEIRSADRREDGLSVDGYERVWGQRDGLNERDPDSGLVGEARRVILERRCGLAEFDLIWPSKPSDPGVSGKGYYRADITVTGSQFATKLPDHA